MGLENNLLNRAADASIAHVEPFLDLLVAFIHSKGLLDIESFIRLAEKIGSGMHEGDTYSLRTLLSTCNV